MPVVIKRYDSCCTTEFVWKNSDKMQIRKNMVGTIAKEWKKVTKNSFDEHEKINSIPTPPGNKH